MSREAIGDLDAAADVAVDVGVDTDPDVGHTDERFWNGRGPHGGWLAAQLLTRMRREVGESHVPRSLHVAFMDRLHAGEFEIIARTIRRNEKAAFVEASLLQDGRICAQATAVFSPLPVTQEHAFDPPAPFTGNPTDVPPLHALDALAAFPRMFEYRVALGWPGAQDTEPVTAGYIRPRFDGPLTHEVLAMLADAWYPAVWATASREPATTVTMSLVFNLPDEAVRLRPGDYLQARFRTNMRAGTFGDESGELWLPDGRLVVQAQQLVLFGSAPEAKVRRMA